VRYAIAIAWVALALIAYAAQFAPSLAIA